MALTGPILIDTVNLHKWAADGTNYPGPFKRGSDLYMVFISNSSVGVFKSVNGGLNWNQLAVAGPVAPVVVTTLCCRRVGATDEIRMAWRQVVAGVYTFVVASFNMATEVLTWPIASRASSFFEDLGGYEWKPIAGEDWLFYIKQIFGNERDALLARWNGAAWLADITYSHLGVGFDTRIQGEISDGADTSHVTYLQLPLPGFVPKTIYYRQISAAGVMTAPILIYTDVQAGGSTFLFGLPSFLDATTIVFPYKKKVLGPFFYYTAAFLSCSDYHAPAPVFTDHDIPGSQKTTETTSAKINGVQQIWWLENLTLTDDDLDRVLSINWDGAAFSNYTIQHDEIANPSFPLVAFQFLHDLAIPIDIGSFGIHIALEYLDPITGFTLCTGFFWIEGAAPPPPVPPGTRVVEGTRRMVVLVPNYFDHCLRAEPTDWRDLPSPSQCCVQDELGYFKSDAPPAGYRAFRQVGAVATPLAAAGDVVVLQFMVPLGYDGVIRGMFHKYTGPGFLEGNGDIIWRLRINNIYAKHLGNVQVSVGSIDQAHPVEDGIPLTSRQWVRYIVNVPNLSGGILPANSQIVCGVDGWFYPRK